MIEFGGITYYLDLAAFDTAITPNVTKSKEIITKATKTLKDDTGKIIQVEEIETITDRDREIDVSRFDILRLMIEIIMEHNEDLDTSLGSERALEKMNLNYQIAFNTLYNYKILKEK